MDSIQAAVVSVKLKHFAEEIELRNNVAAMYTERLTEKNIPSAIHYPMPLPRQEAFAYLNQEKDFPVSDKLSNNVMSLPMHPFLTKEEIDYICYTIKET